MTKPLDAQRIKELRRRKGFTQGELANKAKLSKETVYRYEKGEPVSVRQTTAAKIANALDVAPGVLTGELPLPPTEVEPADAPDALIFETYPLNYQVDGAVRNAFTLAALRYRVPVARIVELAPLLFVLAAETSLQRRTEKLAEAQALLSRADSFWPEHLPELDMFHANQAIRAERASIVANDLLAAQLPDTIFWNASAHETDSAAVNPFVRSLTVETERHPGLAVIERFDRKDVTFHVCPDDALSLCGGDAELADAVISGRVVLHKMPSELRPAGATEKRVAWLREQYETYQTALATAFELLL